MLWFSFTSDPPLAPSRDREAEPRSTGGRHVAGISERLTCYVSSQALQTLFTRPSGSHSNHSIQHIMADNTQNPLNDPFGDLDHQSRTYIALHDAMMKFYEDKKYKECVQLAERLLTEPALPDLFRARAHLILSLRKKSTSSIEHAEQAVSLIEGLRSLVRCPTLIQTRPTVTAEAVLLTSIPGLSRRISAGRARPSQSPAQSSPRERLQYRDCCTSRIILDKS